MTASDRAFGKRTNIAATQRSGATVLDFPLRIKKNIGTPVSIFGAAFIYPIIQLLPLLSQPAAMRDALLHSSEITTVGGALVFVTLLYVFGRNPGELEIAAQGISLADNSGRWFYNWKDVEAADKIKTGVRLRLRGRSDEQNHYNVISNRFGLTSSQLSSLVSAGILRFGTTGPSPSARTVSPGDDLRVASARSRKVILSILGILSVGMFALGIALTLPNCLRVLDLQKNGRATQASVVRIYEADCTRRGCMTYAEYTFTPAPEKGTHQTQYRGYASIGSSQRPNDPNLVYARTYRVLPIVFDVNRPWISQPNFNNRVFTEQPILLMFQILGVFAGVVAVMAAACLFAARKTLFGTENRS